jgi:hypothetical protein
MGASSLDVEPLDVREAGELTIEYGRYMLGIEPEGADSVTQVGKYVVVHESQGDGSTKIAFDIFNANTPGRRRRRPDPPDAVHKMGAAGKVGIGISGAMTTSRVSTRLLLGPAAPVFRT